MTKENAIVKNEKEKKENEIRPKRKEIDCITTGISHISHILNSDRCILYIYICKLFHFHNIY